MLLLASDHNGVLLKSALIDALVERNLPFVDFGPFSPIQNTDYPVIAAQVANSLSVRRMLRRSEDFAILCCGTGIGMSIAANKVPGIRAALVHNAMSALKSREHNDANVLCLGAWINHDQVNVALALEWLDEKFGGGRHVRRVGQIEPKSASQMVFANGVFDILHRGHIALLEWARSLGDRLVVAINSDASARALKGSNRPINSQDDRRAVLSALSCVDEVLIFDEASPYTLIDTLQPSIVVRGGEFTADEIRKRDGIAEHIEIKVFPRVEGYSTSAVVHKARQI